MDLERYLNQYDITVQEFAVLMDITPTTVLNWLLHGVPAGRRSDVIRKTNGAVIFRENPTAKENALIHLRKSYLQLEHLKTIMKSHENRLLIQAAIDDLLFAETLIVDPTEAEIMV